MTMSPGTRQSLNATTAHVHGRPAVEGKNVGIALKSTQLAPAVPNSSYATTAQQIGIGENFVMDLLGAADLPSSLLPSGVNTTTNADIYITKSNDALANATTALSGGVIQAGYAKFGVLEEIDTVAARCLINTRLASRVAG